MSGQNSATPTLLLKGIDIKVVLDDYLNSRYSKEEILAKKKTEVKKLDMTQDTVMGNTNINGIYEIKEGNVLLRVYTTNSKIFDAYMEKRSNSEDVVRKRNIPCVYCRRLLSEDYILSIITSVDTLQEEELTVYYGYDAVCAIKDGG